MRVAVTYDDGKVFQHFGHTEMFKIYNIKENKVIDAETVETEGQGHGALAQFLANKDVDALIAGGIGGGAQAALKKAGIKLYGGVSGDADDAVDRLLDGTLDYNPDVKCSHHDREHGHGEGHECGSRGCH